MTNCQNLAQRCSCEPSRSKHYCAKAYDAQGGRLMVRASYHSKSPDGGAPISVHWVKVSVDDAIPCAAREVLEPWLRRDILRMVERHATKPFQRITLKARLRGDSVRVSARLQQSSAEWKAVKRARTIVVMDELLRLGEDPRAMLERAQAVQQLAMGCAL